MTSVRSLRNGAKAAVLATALLVSAFAGGCAYSGITSTPDGSVVLARNSMLGANRKIFFCHVAGNDLKCTESASPP
jgi:hypothetical protein